MSDADTYMPDFMKLLTSGIKGSEGGLLKQVRSMVSKVQQGMAGISSFSLPELTLPHFDGFAWNFPQGGTGRRQHYADDKPWRCVYHGQRLQRPER